MNRLGIALLLAAVAAQAAASPIPHGSLELVAEDRWITPGHDFYLGFHFQLEPGWHIYWANPGDSGEPPRILWQLPPDLVAGAIEWPAPRRLGTATVVDFGYQDAVLLLAPIHADGKVAPQPAAQLGAEVRVLVCREVCLPGKTFVSLTLPVMAQAPQPEPRARELFATAHKSLPEPAPAKWRVRVDEAKDTFTLTAEVGRRITEAVFFPLNESQVENAAPQRLVSTASGFRLTLRKSKELSRPIERLQGVLEVAGGRAYAVDAAVHRPGATKR